MDGLTMDTLGKRSVGDRAAIIAVAHALGIGTLAAERIIIAARIEGYNYDRLGVR